MTFLQAIFHLLLLTLLWVAVAAQVVAQTGFDFGFAPSGSPRGLAAIPQARRAEWAWLLAAPPIVLWLAQIIAVYGVRGDVVVCGAVWLAGWWGLASLLAAPSRRLALGLLAVWMLAGAGMALLLDSGPYDGRNWAVENALCATLAAAAIIFLPRWARQRPQLLDEIWGPRGIQITLALCSAAAFLRLACFFSKGLYSKIDFLANGIWALVTLGFLIAVPVQAARAVALPVAPFHWRLWVQWLARWRWPLLMAGWPVIALLIPSSDLSPSLLLSCALLVIFWAAGQSRGALLIFVVATSLSSGGFWLLQKVDFAPAVRLNHRVTTMLAPTESGNSQTMQSLWSSARGDLWGRGVGGFALSNGVRASTLSPSETKRRPAVALATTDSIWAIATEILGLFGVSALLALTALASVWLLGEAAVSLEPRRRAWFGGVFTIWTLSCLGTAAWVVGSGPIMGLSAPCLAGGIWSGLLWGTVMALSILAVNLEKREAPQVSPLLGVAPTRRPTQHLIVPAIMMSLLWIWVVGNAVNRIGFRRAEILQMVFAGRADEAIAWDAIMSGAVKIADERLVCAPEALPQDWSEARRKERTKLLQRWIERKAFVRGQDGNVAIAPRAFSQSEPTSLGRVLRLAQEDKHD